MRACFYIFYSLIFLYLISLTKEDPCGTGTREMSVSALGKCKPITDVLGNKDLTLSKNNLLYLASDNEGKKYIN